MRSITAIRLLKSIGLCRQTIAGPAHLLSCQSPSPTGLPMVPVLFTSSPSFLRVFTNPAQPRPPGLLSSRFIARPASPAGTRAFACQNFVQPWMRRIRLPERGMVPTSSTETVARKFSSCSRMTLLCRRLLYLSHSLPPCQIPNCNLELYGYIVNVEPDGRSWLLHFTHVPHGRVRHALPVPAASWSIGRATIPA